MSVLGVDEEWGGNGRNPFVKTFKRLDLPIDLQGFWISGGEEGAKKKRPVQKEQSMSITTTETKNEVAIPDKQLEDKNKTRVTNWALAIGLGAGVAILTAATVYYVRSNQSAKKKKASRYEQVPTIEHYEGRFQKYWTLTTRVFGAVRSTVSEFFSKEKTVSAMVPSEQLKVSPFDSEKETVLSEGEF